MQLEQTKLLQKFFSYRLLNLYAFIIASLLLITSAYLQIVLQLPPCPLCIMQRIWVFFIGILFIPGIFYIPKIMGRRIYNGIIFFLSIGGIMLASRHIYLQHHASSSCGPGLNFIFQNLPTKEAIKMLFIGSGDCAKIHWRFLTLTIPEWLLLFFIVFALIALVQVCRIQLHYVSLKSTTK